MNSQVCCKYTLFLIFAKYGNLILVSEASETNSLVRKILKKQMMKQNLLLFIEMERSLNIIFTYSEEKVKVELDDHQIYTIIYG